MLLELRAGDRRADAEAAGLLLDLAQLGDAFDVDQQSWRDQVGLHLHEQVRPAGQDPGVALFRHQQRNRLIERTRRLITHAKYPRERVGSGARRPAMWHTRFGDANQRQQGARGHQTFCHQTNASAKVRHSVLLKKTCDDALAMNSTRTRYRRKQE